MDMTPGPLHLLYSMYAHSFVMVSCTSYISCLLCFIVHVHVHCNENPIYVFSEKELCGPRPISTFMCLWAIYTVYSQDRSAYSAAGKYVDRSWEYISRSQTHEWRIGTEAQFLFWEYLFPVFTIASLQCRAQIRIFKLFRSPRIDSNVSIPPA
jgi:hypothetical protein